MYQNLMDTFTFCFGQHMHSGFLLFLLLSPLVVADARPIQGIHNWNHNNNEESIFAQQYESGKPFSVSLIIGENPVSTMKPIRGTIKPSHRDFKLAELSTDVNNTAAVIERSKPTQETTTIIPDIMPSSHTTTTTSILLSTTFSPSSWSESEVKRIPTSTHIPVFTPNPTSIPSNTSASIPTSTQVPTCTPNPTIIPNITSTSIAKFTQIPTSTHYTHSETLTTTERDSNSPLPIFLPPIIFSEMPQSPAGVLPEEGDGEEETGDSSEDDSSEKDSPEKDSSEKDSSEKDSSEKDSSEKDSSEKDSSEKDSSEEHSSEEESSEEQSSEEDSSEENKEEESEGDACYYEPTIQTFVNSTDLIPKRERRSPDPEFMYPVSPYGNCRLLFNEFSTDNPGVDVQEFLEYSKRCDGVGKLRGGSLDGFVSVVISSTLNAIVKVIVHSGVFKERGGEMFHVVGIPTHRNTDIPFNSDAIQYYQMENEGYLPDGRGSPNAILLLHSTQLRSMLKTLTLPGWRWRKSGRPSAERTDEDVSPLLLTEDLIQFLLQPNRIQDMIVYGAKVETDRCDLFERIWPPLAKVGRPEYVIRDWETDNSQHTDYSANRCISHGKPFSPFAWKIGKVTPGEPNDCNNAVAFIVSMKLAELGATVSDERIEIQQGPCTSAHASAMSYRSVSADSYRVELEKEMEATTSVCGPGTNPEIQLPARRFELVRMKYLLDKYRGTQVFPWADTTRLPEATRMFVFEYFSGLVDVDFLLSDDVTPWLVVNINAEFPHLSTFCCAFCLAFTENDNRFDRPSSHLITAIMTEAGYVLTDAKTGKRINTNYFKHHLLENRVHLDAVNYMMEMLGIRILKDYETAILDVIPAKERHFHATKNLFRSVAIYDKLNIPFQSSSKILKQASHNGAAIGHLYQNWDGLVDITYEIGIVNRLVTRSELIARNNPFTLILDGTTLSSTGVHYVIFIFQTFHGSSSSLYHYELATMGSSLSGQVHWDVFWSLVVADKLEEFAIRNLVAVTSDGASAMTSTFMKAAETQLGRSVLNVWCLAHKLNLAVDHAQKPKVSVSQEGIPAPFVDLFQTVFRTINDAHSYFVTSPKKWAALKLRGRRNGFRVRRLPVIKDVRWVSTEFNALTILLSIYQVLVEELQHLMATLPRKKAEGATNLFLLLSTTNFVSSLSFLVDATDYLASVNGRLQRKGTLLVSNLDIRGILLQRTRYLFTHNGQQLSILLEEAECNGVVGCTLDEFETAREVKYKGIELRHDRREMLRDLRPAYLKRLIDLTDFYFPVTQIEMFQIFLPSLFPKYGVRSLKDKPAPGDKRETHFGYGYFNQFVMVWNWFPEPHFTRDHDVIYGEWVALINSITLDPHFQDLRKGKPEEFWPAALENSIYAWTPATTRLINIILSITGVSVEAEATFSRLGWVSGKRRTLLDPKTLDHILRIQYNIPTNVHLWDPMATITSWLQNGHCLADDASCGQKKSDREEEPDDTDGYDQWSVVANRQL